MNWFGGGFISIIIYGGGAAAVNDPYALLTESSNNILTESVQNIDIEH
jgi:hypothetical protein